MIPTHFKIVIVGAGPGGISAAAHAAELGIEHVLLEGSAFIAHTIHRFQRGKVVMAEPVAQPLRSSISFAAGAREQVLQTWADELLKHQVNTRLGATVSSIGGQKGDFTLTLSSGDCLHAEYIVLAIGLQGNIRKLGVPGEDFPGVQYQLDDPVEYTGETIVVVGGGDAAVENALALAEQNRVILVNRQGEFGNCKEANLELLMQAVSRGKIETQLSTFTERVEATPEQGFPLVYVAQTPQGQEHMACHRVIARLGATPPRKLVESFGVVFASCVPQLSAQYESNVPGLYVVGSLAGYPLIKQAINQGYEVIEYIMGRPVEPVDEPMLREKFAGLGHVHSVADGIDLIRNKLPWLSPLTSLQLREFVQASAILTLEDGHVVFQQNDYSNSFFSILSGAVRIQIEDDEGQTSIVHLSTGDFFGEIGLLSGRRRSATVVAQDHCVLIETPRRYMIKLLSSTEGVQRKLDEVALRRVLSRCLNESLTEPELDYLVEDAKSRHYCVGDILFHEGDRADGLYLIRRGSVTVSRLIEGREVVLSYVSAGNYVGEMALVSNKPRSATVRAASPTEVVLLEAQRLGALMARNPEIRIKVDN
ncbi:MAG: cyclic nucleotide-binding protein [Comamonadaceae bacterium]|nr:MAG: cyclic nucleotide-binding protein [Comamonadaceae bacterium]